MAADVAVKSFELLHGPIPAAVSDSLRSLLIAAPGHDFVVADFANIEGRILAWMAGETWKIEAFREYDAGRGADIYALAYARSFGITPEAVMENKMTGNGMMRQVGKVQELALGYQGGVHAFLGMAKNYGVNMADAYEVVWESASLEIRQEAEAAFKQRGQGIPKKTYIASDIVKQKWRIEHPRTKQYWRDLEDAAIAAAESPGSVHRVGNVMYKKAGSFLWCRLPSGRSLCYPYPRIELREVPWTVEKWVSGKSRDEVFFLYGEIKDEKRDRYGPLFLVDVPAKRPSLIHKGVDSVTHKWRDRQVYGGLLAENVVQAASRDLLAEAMLRVDPDYPVVKHVHDEVISEVPKGFGSLEDFENIVSEVPPWAAGLPVSAAGWRGERYRKD